MINNVATFSNIFNGGKYRYGLCEHIDPTGDKDTTEKKDRKDILERLQSHLNGTALIGRSPVDEDTHLVSWCAIDIDKKIPPKDFCSTIFKNLGTQYFCFQTVNKGWRVVEFFDEPIDVELGHERAKQIEQRIEKELLIKCDTGATVPTVPDSTNPKAVGRWIYLPYSKFNNSNDVLFTPDGRPLDFNKFAFRYKYRNHPIVVACVGMLGQPKDSKLTQGSRAKALYNVALYLKHFNVQLDLEELNNHFENPLPYDRFKKEKNHVEKSILKDNYDEQYYLNGQSKWISEICGVRPYVDAKGFSAITSAIVDKHYYVQSRTDFFEKETREFKSKEQINDWWRHEIDKKKGSMSDQLLKESKLEKVRSYFTHAGFAEGVVQIKDGDIKGLPQGTYLNVYEPSTAVAAKGDITRVDEYYRWLLGDNNWDIIKMILAFMLNAKEEIKHNGIKIQWFTIIHSKIQGAGKKLFAQLCQSIFGYRNVKPNVKFSQMTGTHSTIIEGAQLIFLNEVVLQKNTAKTKELSNEFKDLITEDNLIINPKNKPQIEIPNVCNFFVFSNSDTPLFIEDEDRRAFVINIKRTKEEVKQKLETEGYKWDILNAVKDPSAFMWHLQNEITYDRNIFFTDAPITKDKEELIENNKDDIEALLSLAYENEEFPFGNYKKVSAEGTPYESVVFDYKYNGLIHPLKLWQILRKHEDYKGVFFNKMDIEKFIKERAIVWPNGQLTRQAKSRTGKKLRLYILHAKEFISGRLGTEDYKEMYNLDMTETELYDCYHNLGITNVTDDDEGSNY